MTDYSTSKFQNATAEQAYAVILDGMQDASAGSVQGGEAWDLVTLDGRHVIVRTDEQGFVWVHDEEQHHSVDHARIARVWAEIVAAVEGDDDAI